MATEKIYYADSFCRRFTASVLDCQPARGGWNVTLDRTAFYPEGGGQPADHGVLGGVQVLDVHEKGGEILHLCDGPLTVGEEVEGILDWNRRFDYMQGHSGEHMVSGTIHGIYGYDNVGFHMGAECITIDFNGPLTWEQLMEVEDKVNRKIWDDEEVEISFYEGEELVSVEYRSKKELSGQVRIVTFPGADTCACCGTHVVRAGQVGLVKILSVQTFRSGVRVEMLAGAKALEYLSCNREQNRAIAQSLSVKPEKSAAAVEKLKDELAQTKLRLIELENSAFARQAESLRGKGDVLVFEDGLTPDGVRRLAIAVSEVCGGRAAVFSGEEGAYKYAMGHPGGDLRELTKTLNSTLNGRGGGKPDFVQGGVSAAKAEIEAFFAR